MNVFNAVLVIFFTLCFAVLIFFLGLWVGKLVALKGKEKMWLFLFRLRILALPLSSL